MFGLFLVIIGIVLLLQEMGLIGGDFWGYLWAIFVILFGFSLMDKGHSKCCSWSFLKTDKKKSDSHKVVDEQ